MDTYDAIAARKTIRDFDGQELTPELIRKIIGAGFNAPTNNHLREWHFILLQDRERRKDLIAQLIKPVGRKGALDMVNRWQMTDEIQREMYIDGISKQYSMLLNAGALILPCFRQTSPLLKPKTLSELNAFASIWCCVENMLVAAAAEGVFGVVRIPFKVESLAFNQILGVPEDFEVPCWLALGYPAPDAKRARQVEIHLDERLHWNGFGG